MTIKKLSSRGDPEECSYPHPLIRKRHKSAERPGFSKRSRKAGNTGQNEAEARMAEEVERHEHDVPHALSPSPPRPLKCQIANSQSPRTLERRGETGERAENSLGHHFVDCQRSTLSSFIETKCFTSSSPGSATQTNRGPNDQRYDTSRIAIVCAKRINFKVEICQILLEGCQKEVEGCAA